LVLENVVHLKMNLKWKPCGDLLLIVSAAIT